VAVIAGIIGIVAAAEHGTWIDTAAMMGATWVSIPVFYSSLLLILLFSFRLGWFPATGQGGIQHPARHRPGLSSAAALARVRSSMLEVLSQDYIVTARASDRPSAGSVMP
jgi:peptide/nickel transport system permease protein